MDIQAELRYFNAELNKLEVEGFRNFPDAIASTGYQDVTEILSDITVDLDKAHRFNFSRPGIKAKYNKLYQTLNNLSMEMLQKRTLQFQADKLLPPTHRKGMPEPTPEESYIVLCSKYVFSAKYALDELKDGWNKTQERA